MLQTAELLRQLEDLPLPVAQRARMARLMLLREPVVETFSPTIPSDGDATEGWDAGRETRDGKS
jgi:hypothetical protein